MTEPTMTTDPRSEQLAAYATLLAATGFTVEEVVAAMNGAPTNGPTVGAYIDTKVIAALKKGQRKVWRPYLRMLADGYPDLCACTCPRCLEHFGGDSAWTPCPCRVTDACDCPKQGFDDANPDVGSCGDTFAGFGEQQLSMLSPADISVAARWAKQRALKRHLVRNAALAKAGRKTTTHTGASAEEHLRAAASFLFRLALDDPTVRGVDRNHALGVKIDARASLHSRAYTPEQVDQLWQALFTSGSKDIDLDVLVIWFLLETGSRRGGPLGLTLGDLSFEPWQVRLGEKNNKVDQQPATPSLVMSLLEHALRRGCGVVVSTVAGLAFGDVTAVDVVEGRARVDTNLAVFYYHPRTRRSVDEHGTTIVTMQAHPLTRKYFETLYSRLRGHLGWLDDLHARPHDLRKTAATYIERAYGYAVAQRWLRHTIPAAAGTYVMASDDENRAALEWWTGTQDLNGVA